MISVEQNRNVYKSFSSIDYSSKKNFLAAAYSNKPVQYYNDETTVKKKKNKKTAISIFLALSTVGIATAAIFGSKKIDFQKLISENVDKLKDNEVVHRIEDLNLKNKIANMMSNFTNIKDDLWDRLAQKTEGTPFEFIKKGGDKLTDVYLKIVHKATKGKYEKAYDALVDAVNKEGLSLSDLNISKFDDWFKSLNNGIVDLVHKDGKRITDNLFGREMLDKVTKSNIADDKLIDLYKSAAFKISIPKNASDELIKAIDEFNEAKTKTAEVLLPKLRDINLGSAPTDVITVGIIPAATLGVAVHNADDEEDKKSILINLGIPLLTATATTTIAIIRCLSGAKAMIFGFALGQAASFSARTIDKFLKKKTQKDDKDNKNVS